MTKINPEILIWARVTAGLSIEDASRKIGLSNAFGLSPVERLLLFEEGREEPTRSLISRMAKQYRRPLLAFYLKEPPSKANRGQDFRILPEDYSDKNQGLIDALIRDIKVRQSIMRSAMLDEDDVVTIDFINSMSPNEGAKVFTERIYDLTNLKIDDYYKKPNQLSAFNFLRSKIEELGVFVLLIGDLGNYRTSFETSIFRGFALSDSIAPFIVINDNDSKSAWAFTLIHEFTHLLLGQTGISNSFSDTVIEKFCNTVASHVLLPNYVIDKFPIKDLNNEKLLRETIRDFAEYHNLSNSMVAYRLFLDDLIDKDTWFALNNFYSYMWHENRNRERRKSKEKPKKISYYIIRKHRLGEGLISSVHEMTYSGLLTTIKAGVVLGINPKKIQNLFERPLPISKK